MTANLDVDMSLDMDVDVDMPPTPRRVVHQKNVSGQTKKLEHKTNKSQMVENRPWLEVSIQCICLDSSFVFDLELPLQTEGLDIWSCVLRSLECLPVRCRRGVSISYFQLLFFFFTFFFHFLFDIDQVARGDSFVRNGKRSYQRATGSCDWCEHVSTDMKVDGDGVFGLGCGLVLGWQEA